jgi:hypothetical protein
MRKLAKSGIKSKNDVVDHARRSMIYQKSVEIVQNMSHGSNRSTRPVEPITYIDSNNELPRPIIRKFRDNLNQICFSFKLEK